MNDIKLSQIEIEDYMKCIKKYLLCDIHNSNDFALTTVQQKYLNLFVPNSNEVNRFTGQFQDILELIQKKSKDRMTEIINDFLFLFNEDTKKKPSFSSILGENWEDDLNIFNDIQLIKENMEFQIKSFYKQRQFESVKLKIYSKLNISKELFHNGYISNLFLKKYLTTNCDCPSFSVINFNFIGNEFQNDSIEYKEDQPVKPFDFYKLYNILQSNESLKLREKIKPKVFVYTPFFDIEDKSEEKSFFEEDSKAKKLKAYKKLYIQKYKEKVDELFQRKKAEEKEKFRKSYIANQLKKQEINKLKEELDSLTQQSKDSFEKLIHQIEDSKLIDLSKISVDDHFAIQKVLVEKIEKIKNTDISKVKEELEDANDWLFQKLIQLQQWMYRYEVAKEKVDKIQSQQKNSDKIVKLKADEPIKAAFCIYAFVLKYRKIVLELPPPKPFVYPQNYEEEFASLVNKNGLEWLLKELCSLL